MGDNHWRRFVPWWRGKNISPGINSCVLFPSKQATIIWKVLKCSCVHSCTRIRAQYAVGKAKSERSVEGMWFGNPFTAFLPKRPSSGDAILTKITEHGLFGIMCYMVHWLRGYYKWERLLPRELGQTGTPKWTCCWCAQTALSELKYQRRYKINSIGDVLCMECWSNWRFQK